MFNNYATSLTGDVAEKEALYERLRAYGKTGKQALIAVCNKLLKQVFAVVKNNSLYQPNYCSAKP